MMKRVIGMLLATGIISASLLGGQALLVYGEDDGYTYYISDGKAVITGYDRSASGDITIPSEIDGYPVTAIGDGAFYWYSLLTSITIPNSVVSIGNGAFAHCVNLVTVNIGDGVISAGYSLFYKCSSLTTINVTEGNLNYASQDGVLFNKYKTELIAYPSCRSGSYNIPDSVTAISSEAFAECQKLETLTIGDNITSIGGSAFQGSSLSSVTIGSGVTSIENSTFAGCPNLESVTLGNNIASIEAYAFTECASLKSITIPKSVTSIVTPMFYYCHSLTSINVEDDNAHYTSRNGVLFNKEQTELISYPAGKSGAYSIPDGVTSVGIYAFSNCYQLPSVTIPNSVIFIGDFAFQGCSDMVSVTMGNSVSEIGSQAFFGCVNLEEITLPDTLTSIGSYAFADCSRLALIKIPGSVSFIGDSSFSGCNSLTAISVESENHKYASLDGVLFNKEMSELYVYPVGKIGSYAIPKGVISIRNSAFFECRRLTSVTIPESVIFIDDYAFSNCGNLTSFAVVNPETEISDFALYNCYDVTIYGEKNSTAQQYAAGYIPFKDISRFDPLTGVFLDVEAVVNGETLTNSISISNESTGDEDVTLYLVLYDDQNNIECINKYKYMVYKDSRINKTLVMSASLENGKKYTQKIFMWNEKMQPYQRTRLPRLQITENDIS